MSLPMYIALALLSGNFLLLAIGGGVHYHYYFRNRDQAAQWKVQPTKFLSDKLAREQRLLGWFNFNVATMGSGVLMWGIAELGWTQLYFDFSEHSVGYTIASVFFCWLLIETLAFYIHAGSHIGILYSKMHRIHHKYTAPSFWALSAMHPVEWLFHVSYIALPAFLFPMHPAVYLGVVGATFICGYWDHCGIKLPFDLPLHGSNRFHDDHHKYFHVNFGFTCSLFDRIHDTVRREGHHYTEETFANGKGRVKDPVLRERNAIGRCVDYSSRKNYGLFGESDIINTDESMA
ncbi:MAG: sterol desaturase family protein [Halioglobus sp.]